MYKDTKTNEIVPISKHLNVGFVVVIYAHRDRMLGVILTDEIIAFAASIGADIGFDMYLD